jgi:hypothetical protein
MLEYFNEYGLAIRIKNGRREVFQDLANDRCTWISIKFDSKLISFIDILNNNLAYSNIPSQLDIEPAPS